MSCHKQTRVAWQTLPYEEVRAGSCLGECSSKKYYKIFFPTSKKILSKETYSFPSAGKRISEEKTIDLAIFVNDINTITHVIKK